MIGTLQCWWTAQTQVNGCRKAGHRQPHIERRTPILLDAESRFLRESLAPDDHFIPAQRQAPKSHSPVFVGLKHALYACRLANNSANCPDAPARRIGHLKPQLSAYPLRKRNGGPETNCDQREEGVPHLRL